MVNRRILMLALLLTLIGCGAADGTRSGDLSARPIRVVTTTTMLTDLVTIIGGERVAVEGLMGAGVDPHLYKASEGDMLTLADADIIFYGGLHLEAKLTDVFEQMKVPTVPVGERIDQSLLISSPDFQGSHDPHIWFDVQLWMRAAEEVRKALSELDPASAHIYSANTERYLAELTALDAYVREQIATLPDDQRVLLTAHDAFNYFGRAYSFEVRGLQGISTASEASTGDVQALADFIVERQIPAIFVESAVSPKTVEAVQAAVRAKGFEVAIGGQLYADALGDPGTPEGTYLGMVRHNVDTIVTALSANED